MIDRRRDAMPLDLSYMKDLVGESPDFLIEMLDVFLEQIPKYIDDLEQSIQEKHWKEASAHAHKLRPIFFYVGRGDVGNHLQEMETNAREQINLAGLEGAFEMLKQFVVVLLEQIKVSRTTLLQA